MQAYEEHVQELDRLRWIYEASQLQLITALAWQAKQEAMLASAKASIDKPSALQVHTATHDGSVLSMSTVQTTRIGMVEDPVICHGIIRTTYEGKFHHAARRSH